jgi:hypothetical protein
MPYECADEAGPDADMGEVDLGGAVFDVEHADV